MGIEPEDSFTQPELIVGLQIKPDYSVVASLIEVDRHSIRLLQFQDSKFLVVIESLLLQVIPEPSANQGKGASQSQSSSVPGVIVEVFTTPGCDEIRRKLTLLLEMMEVKFCFQTVQPQPVTGEETSLLEYLLKEPITHYIKKVRGFEECLTLTSSVCQRYRLMEDPSNHKCFAVKPIDLSEYMRLDNNAIQALGIMPKKDSLTLSDKDRDCTLFGILNTCRTQMGPRTLRRWLLQPMVERDRIEERLDLVEYLVINESIINYVSNSFLARITDLEKIGIKLYKTNQGKRSKSSIMDVVKVYQALMMTNTAYHFLRDQVATDRQATQAQEVSKQVKSSKPVESKAKPASSSSRQSLEDEVLKELFETASEADPEQSTSLMHKPSKKLQQPQHHRLARVVSGFERCLTLFGNFVECVEKYVDLEKSTQGEYCLKEAASKQLAELLVKRKAVEHRVKTFVRELEQEVEVDIGLEKDGYGAFIIKLPKRAEKKIGLGGYSCKFKLVSARANHMMLTCSELKAFSQEHSQLDAAIFEEQQYASQAILQSLASFYPAVEELGEFLGELDAVCSIARFSRSSLSRTMARPNFNSGEQIIMRKSRHPILDRTLGSSAVANDCQMIRDRSSFHIITGPNMGGKSTFIRQVAVNILLAQIGSFCPAEYVEVPIFDCIVTRVGAGDAQSKGLSTWMSELLEVSCMLESATSNTFLVIDELGRGTSTSEGVGMTYAIAEHIIDNLRSFCLFATHYFELTSLEQARSCAQNYHVQAEMRQNNLEMSYQIKSGHTSKSFGVQVLSMLKFPNPTVDFAAKLSTVLDRKSFLVGGPQATANIRSGSRKGTLDEEMQPEQLTMDSKVQFIKYCKQLAGFRRPSAHGRSTTSSEEEEKSTISEISPQLNKKLAMLMRQEQAKTSGAHPIPAPGTVFRLRRLVRAL